MAAIVDLLQEHARLDAELKDALATAEAQLQESQAVAQLLGMHALAVRPHLPAATPAPADGGVAGGGDEQPTADSKLA